jgi:hypothetical protein
VVPRLSNFSTRDIRAANLEDRVIYTSFGLP